MNDKKILFQLKLVANAPRAGATTFPLGWSPSERMINTLRSNCNVQFFIVRSVAHSSFYRARDLFASFLIARAVCRLFAKNKQIIIHKLYKVRVWSTVRAY